MTTQDQLTRADAILKQVREFVDFELHSDHKRELLEILEGKQLEKQDNFSHGLNCSAPVLLGRALCHLSHHTSGSR
jgi:hypothetical protein